MSASVPAPESALGSFLRARRESLTPSDVGLPVGLGVRRTPGLRREELAAIGGISVDYYTRLERGKENRPSAAVVDALTRALRLDAAESAHLWELVAAASHRAPAARGTARPARSTVLSSATKTLLQQMRPNAVYVTNATGDLLAATPAGMRLLPGMEDWPEPQRNISRYTFLDPHAKSLFGDWDAQVAGLVGSLRAQVGINPDDPELTCLVGELLVKSPHFARIWDHYDVRRRTHGSKTYHHPEVGDIHVSFQEMRLEGSEGLSLMMYTAEPGTEAYDQFTLLDALGSDDQTTSASRQHDNSPTT